MRSFKRFAKAAWRIVEPGRPLHWNWHHDVISDHLEAIEQRRITRLVVNIPPRSTKSTLVSVLFPVWCWLRDPSVQFLTGSHAGPLAVRDALKSRRLVESPWFQARWPHVKFHSDQNQKTRYEIEGGGHRITFGMTSGVAGDGGDVLIIDDPHPSKDGMWSQSNRDDVKTKYDQELTTRLNDPTTSAIIIVMQRLHEDDLTGHVLEQGGFVHLRLPMEYEASSPCVTPLGVADPRTEDGELLHSERMPREWVDKQKLTLGSYGVAGQFQQRPAPAGGGLFRVEAWRYYDALPASFDCIINSWDLTFDETKDGSFVVGQCWGKLGPDYYLIEQVRKRLAFTEQIAAIEKLRDNCIARGCAPTAILIENKANGAAAINTLKRRVSGIKPWPPKGQRMSSKVVRAAAWSPLQEAGNVLLPSPDTHQWVRDFVRECAAFPNAANDDQVDAASQALEHLVRDPGLMFSAA